MESSCLFKFCTTCLCRKTNKRKEIFTRLHMVYDSFKTRDNLEVQQKIEASFIPLFIKQVNDYACLIFARFLANFF